MNFFIFKYPNYKKIFNIINQTKKKNIDLTTSKWMNYLSIACDFQSKTSYTIYEILTKICKYTFKCIYQIK